MIKHLRVVLVLLLVMSFSSSQACRFTIREIGFSSLSKVSYVLYRIDANASFIPKQQMEGFSDSNVKMFGLSVKEDKTNRVIQFAIKQDLNMPAYVLAAPDGRMIALEGDSFKNTIEAATLLSPARKQLIAEMPTTYAAVILIEGREAAENGIASDKVLKACERIESVMPHMPKQVSKGPKMIFISNEQFEEEKVMLWSLGLDTIPEHPTAFIVYGRGRIMGDGINYSEIQKGAVYKLLSIIGADCECGLDRKWMLGYQMPLDWPAETRQSLSNILGFDVDNPMVLTEMSRILAIENNLIADPDGISFEPVTIDLEMEFNDVPEIEHMGEPSENTGNISSSSIIIYSLLAILFLIGIGAFLVLRKK